MQLIDLDIDASLPPPPALSAESSLSGESSLSASTPGTSVPVTPADEEALDPFATPRKAAASFVAADGKMLLDDEPKSGLLRFAAAVAHSKKKKGRAVVWEAAPSSDAHSSPEDDKPLQFIASGDTLLESSSDDNMATLGPSLRQTNAVVGASPPLGRTVSGGSPVADISDTRLSDINSTYTTSSLISAPDSTRAKVSPRLDNEAALDVPSSMAISADTFPRIYFDTSGSDELISSSDVSPRTFKRLHTSEDYDGDSSEDGRSLPSKKAKANMLQEKNRNMDARWVRTEMEKRYEAHDEIERLLSLGEHEHPYPGALQGHERISPLVRMLRAAFTPVHMTILGATQALFPLLLPYLLFAPAATSDVLSTLWPRSPPPRSSLSRLALYTRELVGANKAFLFVLLLLGVFVGPVGLACVLVAIARAAWVWGACAFEPDVDRAVGENEDMACAWAVMFGKEWEVLAWMTLRAGINMECYDPAVAESSDLDAVDMQDKT